MAAFSRIELHALVWSEPIRVVAQRVAVSGVWLRKQCVAANIPVPERGYWAKLRAGQAVARAKLPPRAPGQTDTIKIGKPRWDYGLSLDLEAELATPMPPTPQFDEPIEAVRERVRVMVGKLTYQRNRSSAHPLIAKRLADDEERKRKKVNHRYGIGGDPPLFDSPFERRRWRILDCLFLGLAKVGVRPLIDDNEGRNIGLVVGDTRVSFRLDHPGAKPDRNGRWKTLEGFADLLRLTIDATGLAWSDTVEDALETHLTDIAVELIVAGEANFRANALGAYNHACQRRHDMELQLERRRAEAERQRREQAVKAELQRQTVLLQLAASYQSAKQIRDLIDQVLLRRSGGLDADSVQRWASWASAIAERMDPIPRLHFDADGHAALSEIPPPLTP